MRGQYHALLLHLAQLEAEAGALAKAMRLLRTLLMADPCHEEAARVLMRLLADTVSEPPRCATTSPWRPRSSR